MSLFESASLVVTPNGTKASKLYAVKPVDGSGDLSVTRATTATRVNSAGLIESVANNVPRLDYLNSTCPSILVEPQRTNLALRSEEFDNAVWGKLNLTVIENNSISPNGTLTADKIIANSTNSNHLLFREISSFTSLIPYTFSFYAKASEYTKAGIRIGGSGYSTVNIAAIDLTNGNIISQQGFSTLIVTNVNNGWYRIQGTFTSATALIPNILPLSNSYVIVDDNFRYLGNGTSGIFIWGAQLEAGAKATSYIPTTTAAVTRNADVISKTGISSLIGQTEGTVFADININNLGIPTRTFTNITSGSSNFVNLTFLNTNVLRTTIRANAGTQYNVSTSALPIGRYKLAATYKAGELKLYVNGVSIGTNTNASVSWSTALERLNLDNSVLGTDNFSDKINLVAIWTTALTNNELATLTTI